MVLPAGLTELRDWIDQLERFWQGRLAALAPDTDPATVRPYLVA